MIHTRAPSYYVPELLLDSPALLRHSLSDIVAVSRWAESYSTVVMDEKMDGWMMMKMMMMMIVKVDDGNL